MAGKSVGCQFDDIYPMAGNSVHRKHKLLTCQVENLCSVTCKSLSCQFVNLYLMERNSFACQLKIRLLVSSMSCQIKSHSLFFLSLLSPFCVLERVVDERVIRKGKSDSK